MMCGRMGKIDKETPAVASLAVMVQYCSLTNGRAFVLKFLYHSIFAASRLDPYPMGMVLVKACILQSIPIVTMFTRDTETQARQ